MTFKKKDEGIKTVLTETQHYSVVKEKCSDGKPSVYSYLLPNDFKKLLCWLTKYVGLFVAHILVKQLFFHT
jgi:hypothetical protein